MTPLDTGLPSLEVGGREAYRTSSSGGPNATRPQSRRAAGVRGFCACIGRVAGALVGLLLVYSTDLPQIDELEHYRPSAITELYDNRGRVIGSFALQRRVIASYDDYPKVLRDAIISIEDKDFDKHWGINFWRILGAALSRRHHRSTGAGRFHAHDAALAQSLSYA